MLLHISILILLLPKTYSEIVITPSSQIMEGVLVDGYRPHGLLVRLTPPAEIIRRALLNLDKNDSNSMQFKRAISVLKRFYTDTFQELLDGSQAEIASSLAAEHGQPAPAAVHRRNNYMKLFQSGAGKFGGVAKEMADMFGGAMHQQRYLEVSRLLDKLHERRLQHFKLFANQTIITTSRNRLVMTAIQELRSVVATTRSYEKIKRKCSKILDGYIHSLHTALIRAGRGKLSPKLLPIDAQRSWFELILPAIKSIGKLSDLHLQMRAFDRKSNQIVIKVDIPVVNPDFPILRFVEWEPMVHLDSHCFILSERNLYLAYPANLLAEKIKNPLLINPESCLVERLVYCKSDCVLDAIPGLVEDRHCAGARRRREADTGNTGHVRDAAAPHLRFDLTDIIDKTLNNIEHEGSTRDDTQIEGLRQNDTQIEGLRQNETQTEQSRQNDTHIEGFRRKKAPFEDLINYWRAKKGEMIYDENRRKETELITVFGRSAIEMSQLNEEELRETLEANATKKSKFSFIRSSSFIILIVCGCLGGCCRACGRGKGGRYERMPPPP